MENKEGFIKALSSLTKEWREDKDLFKGGCAFASAVLARTLEKAGIPYDVIVYDLTRLDVLRSHESCGHMAIRAKLDRKRKLIGGEFKSKLCNVKTNLGEVKSDDLFNYYREIRKKGEWNPLYEVENNSTYSRLCNNILKKFAEN